MIRHEKVEIMYTEVNILRIKTEIHIIKKGKHVFANETACLSSFTLKTGGALFYDI